MRLELTGQRFGRYTVISRDIRENKKRSYWNVLCDCGNTRKVGGYALTNKEATSCGCYHKENQARRHTIHSGSFTPEYCIWENMISRCTNPKNKYYKNYGGRGITVSLEWRSYKNFIVDMGERPERYTLERIDNNGNYCKENCKWASRHDQARNKRNNHNLTYNDVTMCLTDWAKSLGISPSCLDRRLRKWTLEEALTKPATDTPLKPRTAI